MARSSSSCSSDRFDPFDSAALRATIATPKPNHHLQHRYRRRRRRRNRYHYKDHELVFSSDEEADLS